MNKIVARACMLSLLVFTTLTFIYWKDIFPQKEKKEASVAQQKVPKASTRDERKALARTLITSSKKEIKGAQYVNLDSFSGRKAGDLYMKYLNLPKGPFPPYVTVSFDERMARMYEQKVEFARCSTNKLQVKTCVWSSETVLAQAPLLLSQYLADDKMKMSLHDMVAIASERVKNAQSNLKMDALCKDNNYKLSLNECSLLKSIFVDITGKDLLAYGMTELLPSADGKFNVMYMNMLLREAGASFVYHVPALGDGYASLGLYQFTMFALRNDHEAVAGASRVNAFVQEGGMKIPDSVVYLRGHDHHTAAYFFAVNNVATLLRKLSDEQVATLAKLHKTHKGEMVMIIACAHHNPKHTFKTVARWLDAMEKYEARLAIAKKKGKAMPQEPYLEKMFPASADMRMYAIKSAANTVAMHSM